MILANSDFASTQNGPLRLACYVDAGAHFSVCHQYRYVLWRTWEPNKKFAMFVGLNPSTADAESDDPTIRKCVGFARRWGYGGVHMLNLFSYRATNPKQMLHVDEPVGEATNQWLAKYAAASEIVVACWGAHGAHRERWKDVCEVHLSYARLSCFGLTRSGMPRHPLYIGYETVPVQFAYAGK